MPAFVAPRRESAEADFVAARAIMTAIIVVVENCIFAVVRLGGEY